jgi:hypothetical protein
VEEAGIRSEDNRWCPERNTGAATNLQRNVACPFSHNVEAMLAFAPMARRG